MLTKSNLVKRTKLNCFGSLVHTYVGALKPTKLGKAEALNIVRLTNNLLLKASVFDSHLC